MVKPWFILAITAGFLAGLIGIGIAWVLSQAVGGIFLHGKSFAEIRYPSLGLLVLILIKSLWLGLASLHQAGY
jgi:ABC-type multidrug transport system fused ATPase/permease subunit